SGATGSVSAWRPPEGAASWRVAVPRVASACPPEPRAGGAAWQMTNIRAGQAGGRLVTLKRRPEFLGVRSGARWATPAFVLEAKRRRYALPTGDVPRFAFTVSKRIGSAVERNRIKRRLKAAVRDVLLDHARCDY